MMEKLKPCPFCGGEAKIMKMGYPHYIYCLKCGAKVHGGTTSEKDSIKAWNRRTEPKRGKWKPFDSTWGRSVWACDACGETVDVPTLNGKPIFDYCPWCGAKMERSEE